MDNQSKLTNNDHEPGEEKSESQKRIRERSVSETTGTSSTGSGSTPSRVIKLVAKKSPGPPKKEPRSQYFAKSNINLTKENNVASPPSLQRKIPSITPIQKPKKTWIRLIQQFQDKFDGSINKFNTEAPIIAQMITENRFTLPTEKETELCFHKVIKNGEYLSAAQFFYGISKFEKNHFDDKFYTYFPSLISVIFRFIEAGMTVEVGDPKLSGAVTTPLLATADDEDDGWANNFEEDNNNKLKKAEKERNNNSVINNSNQNELAIISSEKEEKDLKIIESSNNEELFSNEEEKINKNKNKNNDDKEPSNKVTVHNPYAKEDKVIEDETMKNEDGTAIIHQEIDYEKKHSSKLLTNATEKKSIKKINEEWKVVEAYNYYVNPSFSGEKPKIVPNMMKGQSKLIQELGSFKQWGRVKLGQRNKIRKEDSVESSVGTIKDNWAKFRTKKNDNAPIGQFFHVIDYKTASLLDQLEYVRYVFEDLEQNERHIQKIRFIMIRLRNTTPEIITGWDYEKARITNNPLANLWVAVNTVLGSDWVGK